MRYSCIAPAARQKSVEVEIRLGISKELCAQRNSNGLVRASMVEDPTLRTTNETLRKSGSSSTERKRLAGAQSGALASRKKLMGGHSNRFFLLSNRVKLVNGGGLGSTKEGGLLDTTRSELCFDSATEDGIMEDIG